MVLTFFFFNFKANQWFLVLENPEVVKIFYSRTRTRIDTDNNNRWKSKSFVIVMTTESAAGESFYFSVPSIIGVRWGYAGYATAYPKHRVFFLKLQKIIENYDIFGLMYIMWFFYYIIIFIIFLYSASNSLIYFLNTNHML
jgi:hypothetical protein